MCKLLCSTLLFFLFPFFTNAQIPSGAAARYTLNGNANDATGSGFNGSITGTTNTTNRLGTANAAISFVAITSSGTLPLSFVSAMQNDFSIGFWFKTALAAPLGSQWYNGISLVDGEVGGVTNDWGINMIDGGKICFGIGNPDVTIKSTSATYNNNAWHFVTATRNKTAGTIILYVDGSQVATLSGTNTAVLNAPSVIGLGRSSAVATGNYTGVLDDIIAYNRVLSSTEVSNLFTSLTATALPLTWLSFSASVQQNDILLEWKTADEINNDYFTAESSADGLHFNSLGTTHSYQFTDKSKSGTWYYRIKQTDLDGHYSYSKTIRADVGGKRTVSIRANPVENNLVLINSNQMDIGRIRITDMSGKIILSKTIENNSASLSIDVRSLQPGYYLLSVDKLALPFVKK